jgi:hypothetical protein
MAGRPPYYETPEDFEAEVEKYFSMVTDKDPATITGLILYLGFSHREALADYEKKPQFSDTVRKAKLRVENEYEKRLFGQQVTGPIFALKNLGWTDKSQTEHSGSIDTRPIQYAPQPGNEPIKD